MLSTFVGHNLAPSGVFLRKIGGLLFLSASWTFLNPPEPPRHSGKTKKAKKQRTTIKIKVLEIKNYEYVNKKGKFSNKNIMLTGGFKKISRSEAKVLIEDNGGKVLGTISKKLNILIVGNSKPTKKKIDRAKELKIQIINEEEWYKILNI